MPKYSVLPTWPFLLFGVIEPACLVLAYVLTLVDPVKYFHDQAPSSQPQPHHQSPQALSVTLQLGNLFLLLALVSLICTWTYHPDIAKRFLLALALGDLGHVYANYLALRGASGNEDYFWRPDTWNAMVWGHIGVSVFLNVNRWLTLLGLFGVVGGRKAAAAAAATTHSLAKKRKK